MKFGLFATAAATCAIATVYTAHADAYGERLTELITTELLDWVYDDDVIAALRDQNAMSLALTQDDINSLDEEWRAGLDKPDTDLINRQLTSSASIHLADKQTASEGLVTEAFVMDKRGLNVAQSAVTTDYWQGDEVHFTHSFGKGADAIYISQVELDESALAFQRTVSVAISDPDTSEVIGAATFGINLELLE